jgi:hypothetical protein
MRPETYEALKPVDVRGEQMPGRIGLHKLLGVAMQGGVPSRWVPDEYWRQASDLNRHALAVVDCTCGQTVIVELAVELRPCPGCQRWFFYAGPDVLALNTPEGVT